MFVCMYLQQELPGAGNRREEQKLKTKNSDDTSASHAALALHLLIRNGCGTMQTSTHKYTHTYIHTHIGTYNIKNSNQQTHVTGWPLVKTHWKLVAAGTKIITTQNLTKTQKENSNNYIHTT